MCSNDKCSSRDEIANVNPFMTISHTYFAIPRKENLLRLVNETIARQVLHIKSCYMQQVFSWAHQSRRSKRHLGRLREGIRERGKW